MTASRIARWSLVVAAVALGFVAVGAGAHSTNALDPAHPSAASAVGAGQHALRVTETLGDQAHALVAGPVLPTRTTLVRAKTLRTDPTHRGSLLLLLFAVSIVLLGTAPRAWRGASRAGFVVRSTSLRGDPCRAPPVF